MKGDVVTVGELGAEILGALDDEYSCQAAGSDAADQPPGWRARHKIVHVMMAVLARHDQELLINDPELPATPLPYKFGETRQVQLTRALTSAGLPKRAEGTVVQARTTPGRFEAAFQYHGVELTVQVGAEDMEPVRPSSNDFNTVTCCIPCPVCGEIGRFEVRYKYGDTWRYHYSIGDRIRWGGNDTGVQGQARLQVDGIGGPCTHCERDLLWFEVTLEGDVITDVTPRLMRDLTSAFEECKRRLPEWSKTALRRALDSIRSVVLNARLDTKPEDEDWPSVMERDSGVVAMLRADAPFAFVFGERRGELRAILEKQCLVVVESEDWDREEFCVSTTVIQEVFPNWPWRTDEPGKTEGTRPFSFSPRDLWLATV